MRNQPPAPRRVQSRRTIGGPAAPAAGVPGAVQHIARVEEARAWAKEHCAFSAGHCAAGGEGIGPVHVALMSGLGIKWWKDGNRRGYQVSEQAARYLSLHASTCPETYDLVRMIGQFNVVGNAPMPAELRSLISQILGGSLTRPKKHGRNRADNWQRDYFIQTFLDTLVERFKVRPTRNDVTKLKDSACDILSEVFAEAGYPKLNYKLMKEIWGNRKLREEARTIREIHETSRSEEPPLFVRLGKAPFAVPEK